jgi:hypothetical protein
MSLTPATMFHVTLGENVSAIHAVGLESPAYLFSDLDVAYEAMTTLHDLEDDPIVMTVDGRGLSLRPDPNARLEKGWLGKAWISDAPIGPERISAG